MTPSTAVCCYCDTPLPLSCLRCGREQPNDPPSTPAPTDAGALADELRNAQHCIFRETRRAIDLEQVIRDSIEALERNSTSAPVVECLKAALNRKASLQETRGDELRAALEPFAKAAPCAEITDLRDGDIVWRDRNPAGGYSVLTKDDFRRAAKAFAAAPQQSPRPDTEDADLADLIEHQHGIKIVGSLAVDSKWAKGLILAALRRGHGNSQAGEYLRGYAIGLHDGSVASQQSPRQEREGLLRTVADLFAESVHETYTREEVVSVVEDMIRLGQSPIPSTDHSAVDAIAERSPGISKGTIRNLLDAELCDDCPPVGYPTDKRRCTVCPRVSSKTQGEV